MNNELQTFARAYIKCGLKKLMHDSNIYHIFKNGGLPSIDPAIDHELDEQVVKLDEDSLDETMVEIKNAIEELGVSISFNVEIDER